MRKEFSLGNTFNLIFLLKRLKILMAANKQENIKRKMSKSIKGGKWRADSKLEKK